MAQRRHLRPGRRGLRALLGRRALARAALREDALRQRAAGARLPARLAADAATSSSGACARRRSTGRCARCAAPRAASTPPSTPTPRARRASSTSGPQHELRDLLGDDAPPMLMRYWGVDRGPNFEGRSILHVPGGRRRPRRCSRGRGGPCTRRARSACGPGLDDKRLTAWNALMISALADAGAVLERPDYLDAARACAALPARDRCATTRRPAAAHLQGRPCVAERLPRGPRVPPRGAAGALRGDLRDALVHRGARARRRR